MRHHLGGPLDLGIWPFYRIWVRIELFTRRVATGISGGLGWERRNRSFGIIRIGLCGPGAESGAGAGGAVGGWLLRIQTVPDVDEGAQPDQRNVGVAGGGAGVPVRQRGAVAALVARFHIMRTAYSRGPGAASGA